MKSQNIEFVVIGLGRFGRSVAKALTSSGAQVMAVPKDWIEKSLKENEVLIVLGRNHLLNRLVKGKHKMEV